MNTKSFDIVIIGAGPAGSTLARKLAATEKKVLLVDGQDAMRPKPCGGLLAPDAQKYFATSDITIPNSVLADPQIFAVDTVDLKTKLVRRYQRHYLNMDRYRFDRYLLSIVPCSVETVEGRVRSIETNGDGSFSFDVEEMNGGTLFRAETTFLVGADGANSVVRRTCFPNRPVSKQYVSIQQWISAPELNPGYYCIFDSDTSDSCSWFMKKNDAVIFGGAFDIEGSREAFDRQKDAFSAYLGISLNNVVKTEACLVDSPRKRSDFQTANGNAFLVGEAAGFISASSFEGISSAMISAGALGESFAEADDASSVASLYKRKTAHLTRKLTLKTFKRFVLCTPFLRNLVMASGIKSIR